MSNIRPEFIKALPCDIARVGPLGACILALVRYATAMPGESGGRQRADHAVWWRATHADIGEALGGLHHDSVRRTMAKLVSAGELTAKPAEAFYGDRAQAYRIAADQPLRESAECPDQPLRETASPITRKCVSSSRGSASAADADPRNPSYPSKELKEGGEHAAPAEHEPNSIEQSQPGNEPPPPDSQPEEQPLDVEADPDPEPQPYCDRHMPHGTDRDCGACMRRRKAHEAWEACQQDRALQRIAAAASRDAPPPESQRGCNMCHDGGLVLTSDGTPGRRHPRVCHHDGSGHPATPDELEAWHRRRDRTNNYAPESCNASA